MDYAPSHIALFTKSTEFRGVERMMFTIANGLVNQGHRVDLVISDDAGPYLNHVASSVNVLSLRPSPGWLSRVHPLVADPRATLSLLLPLVLPRKPPRAVHYLQGLVDYLRRERPTALLAAKTHANLVALWARRLAAVPTRVVISEHVHFSQALQAHSHKWRWRYIVPVIQRFYPWADTCVTVSNEMADDLSQLVRMPCDHITSIYNPVMSIDLLDKARAPIEHAWFQSDAPPVILGAGKLNSHKDFPTLLRAFARLRAKRQVRLMILGEGPHRTILETMARTLGIASDVTLPGFVENPYAYMARAAVFALSSAWEGLPTVLIEALACGCPVVSTDCPSGPAEILAGGDYGRLVPVGDDAALAAAIMASLEHPPPREHLLGRAHFFSVDRAVDQYSRILLGH